MQGQLALALCQRIVDHGARETQALVLTITGTDRQAGFDAVLIGVGESDFLEDAIHRRFDLLDIGWGQRFELASAFPGANRLEVFGQCGPAQCYFCLTGIGTSCHVVLYLDGRWNRG